MRTAVACRPTPAGQQSQLAIAPMLVPHPRRPLVDVVNPRNPLDVSYYVGLEPHHLLPGKQSLLSNGTCTSTATARRVITKTNHEPPRCPVRLPSLVHCIDRMSLLRIDRRRTDR